jgi:hypothetical protein
MGGLGDDLVRPSTVQFSVLDQCPRECGHLRPVEKEDLPCYGSVGRQQRLFIGNRPDPVDHLVGGHDVIRGRPLVDVGRGD